MKSFNKFCGDVVSKRLPVWDFVSMVHDHASHSTGFYSISNASLTKKKLRLVVQELALIHQPIQGAKAFSRSRTAADWLPQRQDPHPGEPSTPSRRDVAVTQAETPKYAQAEMTLVAFLLGPTGGLGRNLQVFPYLGVSKKTRLLCGHMIREVGGFAARGNDGKDLLPMDTTFPYMVLQPGRAKP
ncbi:hypothetical protein ACKVV1_005602 [Pyricularia oryzae]